MIARVVGPPVRARFGITRFFNGGVQPAEGQIGAAGGGAKLGDKTGGSANKLKKREAPSVWGGLVKTK